jgi:hypothetical protein
MKNLLTNFLKITLAFTIVSALPHQTVSAAAPICDHLMGSLRSQSEFTERFRNELSKVLSSENTEFWSYIDRELSTPNPRDPVPPEQRTRVLSVFNNLHLFALWIKINTTEVPIVKTETHLAIEAELVLSRKFELRETKAIIQSIDLFEGVLHPKSGGEQESLVIDSVLGVPSEKISNKERETRDSFKDVAGTWFGLTAMGLNTPYTHMLSIFRVLNLPAGSTVVDMGSGMGRMGLVGGLKFPKLNFWGYEYWQSRMQPAKDTARKLGLSNVHYEQADFASDNFQPVAGDVFFVYWSSGNQESMHKMFLKLRQISNQKPITILARGIPESSYPPDAKSWLKENIELSQKLKERHIRVYQAGPAN